MVATAEIGNRSNIGELIYDEAMKRVTGKGFQITFVGKHTREDIFSIFFYESKEVEFFFTASREVWGQNPENPTKKWIIDTEIYTVRRLWCLDEGCVYRKRDIPVREKEQAKANILLGLMAMEELNLKPPRGVLIEAV